MQLKTRIEKLEDILLAKDESNPYTNMTAEERQSRIRELLDKISLAEYKVAYDKGLSPGHGVRPEKMTVEQRQARLYELLIKGCYLVD